MIKFALFMAFVSFLGWMFENFIGPWMDLKMLEIRAQREIEQQRQLRRIIEGECSEIPSQPVQCICDWFDDDTLIRDPRCSASDHGGMDRLLESVRRSIRPRAPYKFKNPEE